ncbi:short-chain dehydrogenase/reductase SDR [Mycena maculata]|uniref:Short-chain dehydrogenase/reductase SDR n=1 Tax=Mycena maculata TaxID=230809 RepID=A0AAD7N9S8_9AGAR|nr:short-chain dehydrogenase/reductase SDR [Mycena maculata]
MVRTILITGASQGSLEMAAGEEALSKFAAAVHASSTVVPVQLDITDAASIAAAHTFITDFLKARGIAGLDVLVNNAGISTEDFKETYGVNVFGTVAVTTAMRPLLVNGGAILNISSRLSLIASYTKGPLPPILPPYASSKAAINMLTVTWAMQEEAAGSGPRLTIGLGPTTGYNRTQGTNYIGTGDPADGCKVIVAAALETGGRTGILLNKNGVFEW